MRSDGQKILAWLIPALLGLVACGGAKTPGATTGSGGAAAGATAASAGTTGSSGTAGVDLSGAGAPGFGGNAGTTGTAGGAATSTAGNTGTAGRSDGGVPDDGAGADAPPPDAALGGTALPVYDGGVVNVINASNWNETTIHPFSKRRMLVRDQGNPRLVLLDLGSPTPVVWKMPADGAFARSMQLIGNNQILGGTSTGYQVYDFTDGHVIKTVTGFPDTTSAYRMATGETMLSHAGSALAMPAERSITLSFLDKTDKIGHVITYPGFGYVRIPRPTRNGTFLVPADTTLFEGDASGKVLWTASGAEWGRISEALLMSDGNALLATFFGASLDIIDRDTHMVTKRYGTKTMPMAATFLPSDFAELQILPNGNLLTSNWKGTGWGNGPLGVQVIEFDPAGDVVWFYKEDPTVFSAIQGAMVIDGMDPKYLHVQEISPDSTWQPVIPTP
jgi:hypothetical protein